jgi:hypothetical protein
MPRLSKWTSFRRTPGPPSAPASLLLRRQGSGATGAIEFHATRHSDRHALRASARCPFRVRAAAIEGEPGARSSELLSQIPDRKRHRRRLRPPGIGTPIRAARGDCACTARPRRVRLRRPPEEHDAGRASTAGGRAAAWPPGALGRELASAALGGHAAARPTPRPRRTQGASRTGGSDPIAGDEAVAPAAANRSPSRSTARVYSPITTGPRCSSRAPSFMNVKRTSAAPSYSSPA